jgi:hypothetical protein
MPVELAEKCLLRDQLRSARAEALANAEGFHAILRAVELIGQQMDKRIGDLGRYKTVLSNLAAASPLAIELPANCPECHNKFGALYDELRQARNDAVHQGAYARSLTDHAVELAIMLEDALMIDASVVSQFMVRNVVEANAWHPISYVRQQMLTHAFSYLPIWNTDAWKLIPDYFIARLLRTEQTKLNGARSRCLAVSVSEAVRAGNLELIPAQSVIPETPIVEMLPLIGERPLLVIDRDHPNVLVGLLTSSDIL